MASAPAGAPGWGLFPQDLLFLQLPGPCCSGSSVLGHGFRGTGSGSDPIMCRAGQALRMIVTVWLAYIMAREGFDAPFPSSGTPVSGGVGKGLRWGLGSRFPPRAPAWVGSSAATSLPEYRCGRGGNGLADGAVAAQSEAEAGECRCQPRGARDLNPGRFPQDLTPRQGWGWGCNTRSPVDGGFVAFAGQR